MSLLTTKEVSEMTGISEGTLRYYRSIDQGPRSFRLGKAVRYQSEDVAAWIAAQMEATGRGGVSA